MKKEIINKGIPTIILPRKRVFTVLTNVENNL